MEELTLEQAVRKCKENGGRFRNKTNKGAWFIVEETGSIIGEYNEDIAFVLECIDFDEVWDYEPPQSAFQKSIAYKAADCGGTPNFFRKEGWNEAIDYIINKSGFSLTSWRKAELESLKEP